MNSNNKGRVRSLYTEIPHFYIYKNTSFQKIMRQVKKKKKKKKKKKNGPHTGNNNNNN